MKNKRQILPRNVAKKPPRQEISDAEFRDKLKNIDEWRKKRLLTSIL
jgi:hypothetical protein